MLADYFLEKYGYDLDRQRVYELILYHDLVEIYAGDVDLLHQTEEVKNSKQEEEEKAAEKLREKLPSEISDKFYELFEEFEKKETKEAMFAKAVDALDAEIHELDYPEDWKEWSAEFLDGKKRKYFKEFPELEEEFDKILCYLKENDYFGK